MKESHSENPPPKKDSGRKRQLPKKLYRDFMGSIAPYYQGEGLTPTQEPTIQHVIETLAENVERPEEIISKVVESDEKDGVYHEGNIWIRMSDLMEEAETATGFPVKYTPSAFVDSLRPFAEKEVSTYHTASKEKRETQETDVVLEIDEATKEQIKRHADRVLQDPEFVTTTIEEFIDGRRRSCTADYIALRGQIGNMERVREIADAFVQNNENESEFNGLMRSLEMCQEESDQLYPHLGEALPELAFSYGHGSMSTIFPHDVLFVFPDMQTRDTILDLQRQTSESIVSLEGVADPDVPVLDDLTVIDPTVLQTFNDSPFLKNLPFEERIPFAKQIAPGSFSEGGVFVDTYLNYVRFLGLLGIHSSEFSVDTE